MALFGIADSHLSFGSDKPMDQFNGWQQYTQRLEQNWRRLVTQQDTVVLAGDISWAMNFDELIADFTYLENLPGKKILIKGNHDYWWSTAAKMNAFVEAHNFSSISFLHNNAYTVGDLAVCGSRGWFFDSREAQDEKVLHREVLRIRASIEAAETAEKIVFLHYPPVSANGQCKEIMELLHEKGIKKCFYGHLHGVAAQFAAEGLIEGIDFKLISADRLSFTPYFLSKS